MTYHQSRLLLSMPYCKSLPCGVRNLREGARRDFASTSHVPANNKGRVTTIRLYRVLQRQCRSLVNPKFASSKENGHSILLQPDLEPGGLPSIQTVDSAPCSMSDLYQLFYLWNDASDTQQSIPDHRSATMEDWYYEVVRNLQPTESTRDATSQNDEPFVSSLTSPSCWTTMSTIRQAIRKAFQCPYTTLADIPSLHKWAIKAIQTLQQQERLWNHSSVQTTEGIRVVATSRYVFFFLLFFSMSK